MSNANEQAVIGLNNAREAALLGTPRDWSAVRGFFADKFVEYGAWNINSVDDFIERVTQSWEKLQMRVKLEEILSADNRVYARWTLTGIHQQEAFGFAPTGKKLQWESMEVYYFDDKGKITAMRYSTNLIELLAQVGYQVPAAHLQF